MALPLVSQHKDKLCTYKEMKRHLVISITTLICVVLKEYIVGKLSGASWGKEFHQSIDIVKVTSI